MSNKKTILSIIEITELFSKSYFDLGDMVTVKFNIIVDTYTINLCQGE